MKLTGSNYYEKYKDLSDVWGLDEDIVLKVLDKYCLILAHELVDLVENPVSLPGYLKDRRKPEQYVENIISGWLIEEMVLEWFIDRGLSCELAGNDKNRVIQKKQVINISSDADLIVNNRQVEIQLANVKLKSYDVKENKINRALKNNTLIMFLLLQEDCYFVIDPKKDLAEATLYANPRFFGKMCYNFKINKKYNMKEEVEWV